MKAARIKPEIISLMLLSAVLIHVLMLEPVVGVADNGDFERIMSSSGLGHLSSDYRGKYFGYFSRE